MVVNQPQGIKEGIYFRMSNETYHKDPALSHSGMKNILVSWPDYWEKSCLNPAAAEYKPTDAMIFGSRSGELLLEPELFQAKYGTATPADMGKKIYLSSVMMQKLKVSIAAINNVPVARDHFLHGYGEVSIFFRHPQTGIMLRARIDYLRTFGAIDFKRIAQLHNNGIGRAVKDQALDIQHYLYCEAIRAGRRWLLEMSEEQLEDYAERERVDINWLRAFMADEDLMFRFLFQRSVAPYIWEFGELEPDAIVEGCNATEKAIKLYCIGLQKFGIGAPPMGTGEVKAISQYHIPRRDYDYE